jgi:para-aminobenzoate synthetase component I
VVPCIPCGTRERGFMKNTVLPKLDLIDSRPIVEELSPRLDPCQTFRCLASLPHVAFLDSAMPHTEVGRYSFITADPFEWVAGSMDAWAWLKRKLAQFTVPTLPDLPSFQGGAICMFGYDLCHQLEKLPRPGIVDFQTPPVAVGLYDWVIAFDHFEKRSWLISTGLPGTTARQRKKRAGQRIREVWQKLNAGAESAAFDLGTSPKSLAPLHDIPGTHLAKSNFDRTTYLKTVAKAIDYIHAGDCFQVNIAQRLLSKPIGSPLDLYERLRTRNPAPFAAYFDLGEFVIASASPERFLRVQDGFVETRPIKGTRPRCAEPELDLVRQQELLGSIKDRAENVMIVDLLRNDLGRVCEYGSIEVGALCQLETYQFVHHLVSQVRGRLRRDMGPIDLVRAAFPGGSVTGAPKIRAMEIIAELEPTARGPYCGSLACIGFNGFLDSSIVIRTFTIGRGWVQFPVGGGIVADSNPEREYEETLDKAAGMLRALH